MGQKITQQQRKILKVMAEQKGFIWYIDGRKWQFPALCWGKQWRRVTRRMVDRLDREDFINGEYKYGSFTGAYYITEKGRQAVATSVQGSSALSVELQPPGAQDATRRTKS